MTLSVYYRDTQGKIVHHGTHDWPTPAAFLRACYPTIEPKDWPAQVLEKLPSGWPDKSVHWCGNWGYSIQIPKPKLRGINLTDQQVEIAKQIGGGNFSEGVRIALRVVDQIEDISSYF